MRTNIKRLYYNIRPILDRVIKTRYIYKDELIKLIKGNLTKEDLSTIKAYNALVNKLVQKAIAYNTNQQDLETEVAKAEIKPRTSESVERQKAKQARDAQMNKLDSKK